MQDYVGEIGDVWCSEITLYKERRLWVTNIAPNISRVMWILSNIW